MAAARKKGGAKSDPNRIIAQASVIVPIDSVKRYPNNPRVGNIEVIKESIIENGFFAALVVQRSTGYILDGNHRWAAAKELGFTELPVAFVDVDDKTAKKMVLIANRSSDLATYDSEILAEVLKSMDNPVGTGYSQDDYDALIQAVEYHNVGLIDDVIRPQTELRRFTDDETGETTTMAVPKPVKPMDLGDDDDEEQEEQDDEMLDTVSAELQGLLQLNEDVKFKSSNYYGIPDLAKNMLLEKLPEKFDTWAGAEATPDDGVTTWLWNYGVASKKGLPGDRAILCFYTYDTYFEGWWDQPAYYTSKVINMGIKAAVVPDFSLWNVDPTAWHIYNVLRAQWMGRFFQEAGIKVIPRLQFNLGDGGKSLDFCMAGIPKNPPILAASSQHSDGPEDFKNEVDWTVRCLQELEPETFLVYGGNPAKRMMEAVAGVMKGNAPILRHVYNYSHKRRGVTFDKADGLKAKTLAERKEAKKNKERDRYAEPDPVEEPKPKAVRKRRGAAADVPPADDATLDD